MNCIVCKKELPPEAKFCLECGARQAFTCTCGQVLPSDARFCLHCGTKVTESYPPMIQTPVVPTVPQPMQINPMTAYQHIPQFMPYPMGQSPMVSVPTMQPVGGVVYDVYGNPVNRIPSGQVGMMQEPPSMQSGSRERISLSPESGVGTVEVEQKGEEARSILSNMDGKKESLEERVPERPNPSPEETTVKVDQVPSKEKLQVGSHIKEAVKPTGIHVPVVGTGTHEPVPPPEEVPITVGSREIPQLPTENEVVEETAVYGAREIAEKKVEPVESPELPVEPPEPPVVKLPEPPVIKPPEPLTDTPHMINTVVREEEVIPPTTTSTVASFHRETVEKVYHPPEPAVKETKTVYSMIEMGYYGKDLYTDVSNRYGYYQGRVYFKREYELWSSTEEGNDVRLVIPNAGGTILDFAVNSFGVFVWAHEFGVRKFTHVGEFVHTIDVPSHGMIENFAVFGDKVYVIALILVKPETLAPELRGTIKERGEKSLRQRAYIMDFSVKKTRRFEWFPYEFCKVSMVTVGEEGFVAKVAYSHTDGSQVTNESGYYYFNTVQDTGICLSHSKVEPHRMMTGWDKYKLEIEELDYASIRGLQIPFIDLPNNRMWVYCVEEGRQWLEARTLETPELSVPISEIPHWKLPENFSEFDLGYSYFDGIRMYHSSHYSKFESVLRDGSKLNMIEADNFGHGATWDFVVLHELIYIDLYARGLKQYVAGGQGLIELRRMEHPNTKQNVCFQEY